ncbi:MFS transporter [Nocardiopsis synnemataformans]|uniref:MFS transporter n=1 Tax=Nocardiopsis synnemataformans TaxID=61305 RepID=UPI003EB9138F
MRKVALASFMGTVIEFYDFIIYGTAAALVFSQVFFPALGTHAGTVVSFATLGVAFVARPVGAILFGHFGDRMGRKRTLITTMLTMGVATVLIGLLPTAESIGVVAPILLILMRIAQGLAAGGEWAGAALFTSENAPKGRRGFWAMFTNLGGAAANMLAATTFLVTSVFMSDATFVSYGWRIPFVLSALLVVFGLYVRLKLDDTPVFTQQAKNGGTSSLPFKEAVRNQWKQILLSAGTLLLAFALNYMGASYLTNYGTATLGLDPSVVLGAGVLGGLVLGIGIVSGGTLSDRLGRRRVLITANAVGIPWALLLFPLLDAQFIGSFWIGLAVSFLIAGHAFGVAGAFLSELFHTRYRYTAAGLAYSLAGIFGGALPPLLAASIISTWGGFTFGVLLAAVGVVSILSTLVLKETKDSELVDAVRTS